MLLKRLHRWLKGDRNLRSSRPAPAPRRSWRPMLEQLEDRMVLSTLMVANLNDSPNFQAGDGSLRGEIAAAQNGDTIQFNSALVGGSINLSSELLINKNIKIIGDATATGGWGITVNGNGHRVFDIEGGTKGVNVTLSNLNIVGGSANQGGGVFIANPSGTVTLNNLNLDADVAFGTIGANAPNDHPGGSGGSALGGGVFFSGGKSASLILENSTIQRNFADGGQGGLGGNGGIAAISGGTGSGNGYGGAGGAGGTASGAGLYATGGHIQLLNDSFTHNEALGGQGGMGGDGGGTVNAQNGPAGVGGNGGYAQGGGIYVSGSTVQLSNVTLQSNMALGGNAGVGGDKRPIYGPAGTTAAAGAGGAGEGGALYFNSGSVSVAGAVVRSNQASGGSNSSNYGENSAGNGSGAGLYVGGGNLTLDNSALFNNSAHGGGSPTFPGAGTGGALTLATGSATLYDDDLENNTVVGGGTFNGVSGLTFGGAIYASTGTLQLINDTINANSEQGNGAGGGIYNFDTVINMANTIISGNTAGNGNSAGPDFAGYVNSSDHDLIGNTGNSGGFGAQGSGDLLNVNPGLTGLLANFTQQLTAGSVAIGAGDPRAILSAVDQIGGSRMTNGSVDIGASEYNTSSAAGNNLTISGNTSSLVVPGTQLTYTVTVTNHGKTAQSNVTVADVLPANTSFVSWTTSPSEWALFPLSAGQTGTVTAWIGSLASGASATFKLVVAVNSNAKIGSTLSNTFQVGPTLGDPNPVSNSVTLSSYVHAAPVNVSSDVAVQFGGITYDSAHHQYDQTLTLTNTSNLTLSGPIAVELTNLASGVTLDNPSGTIGGNFFVTFLNGGQKWTPGQKITVTLKFTASSASAISYGTEEMQGI